MDKYELAKNLGIDLEELEELGREFRETIDKMNSVVVTQDNFIEWLERQVYNLSKNRKGKIKILKDTTEITYMKYMEKIIGKLLEEKGRQLEDYLIKTGDGKEYEDVFWGVPFMYNGKRYVVTYTLRGDAFLYDVERYGKFLGMGKEKFTNVKYYAEIGEK
ncbi:hypothetical protein NHG35_04805 [Aerococcaceae bacterium NML180378]|nr:hypothetical protein [Aerococcaceae bacterium NML180378]